jgi:hypothetical protein
MTDADSVKDIIVVEAGLERSMSLHCSEQDKRLHHTRRIRNAPILVASSNYILLVIRGFQSLPRIRSSSDEGISLVFQLSRRCMLAIVYRMRPIR